MTTKKTSSTTNNASPKVAAIPAGWETVTTAGPMKWAVISDKAESFTPDDVADATKQLDNVIEGELLGKEEMEADSHGEIRSFYKIKLTRPCRVETKQDGVKMVVIADVGDVVNVGERQKLQPLDALVASGNRWAVYLHAGEKLSIGKGKTMWSFTIGKRLIASRVPAAVPAAE